jgi:hypothetical protein
VCLTVHKASDKRHDEEPQEERDDDLVHLLLQAAPLAGGVRRVLHHLGVVPREHHRPHHPLCVAQLRVPEQDGGGRDGERLAPPLQRAHKRVQGRVRVLALDVRILEAAPGEGKGVGGAIRAGARPTRAVPPLSSRVPALLPQLLWQWGRLVGGAALLL